MSKTCIECGCSFMLSSLPCFPVFSAALLSLHIVQLVRFLSLVYTDCDCYQYPKDRERKGVTLGLLSFSQGIIMHVPQNGIVWVTVLEAVAFGSERNTQSSQAMCLNCQPTQIHSTANRDLIKWGLQSWISKGLYPLIEKERFGWGLSTQCSNV